MIVINSCKGADGAVQRPSIDGHATPAPGRAGMATLTKPGYITLADLQATGACQSQVDLFRATFGDEVKLNKRNLAKALRTQLDVSWCARFLTAPARAECDRVMAAARAEYERGSAAALLAALTAETSEVKS